MLGLLLTLPAACSSSDSDSESTPKAGASCATAEQAACDGSSAQLQCLNGTWTRFECRGAKGCVRTANAVMCDNTIANLDETCKAAGSSACSSDNARLLRCDDGKWTLRAECRGPDKCAVKTDAVVDCDESKGNVGDACTIESSALCSTDDTKIFKCEGGKVVAFEECESGKKCTKLENVIRCK